MCAVASSPVWVRFDPGRTEPVCFKESTSMESSRCIVCMYSVWGESVWGESVWGESVWRESVWGESVWGESVWGESVWRESVWGESVWGESVWGESVWGESVWGESVWRESVWGESVWGESVWREIRYQRYIMDATLLPRQRRRRKDGHPSSNGAKVASFPGVPLLIVRGPVQGYMSDFFNE